MNTITQKPICQFDGCLRLRDRPKYCNAHRRRASRGTPMNAPIRETHGLSRTPVYKVWTAMKMRCLNPNYQHYEYYGGRGIKVCDAWATSFEAFVQDMGPRPEGYTIERLDRSSDYMPSNCVWADRRTQVLNRGENKNNTSGFRGVCFERGRWTAKIMSRYRNFSIGSYSSPEEAAWMYDQWALCLHGDYAQLNFNYV